jgi:SynChlorMet cassette protein ScmD
MQNDDKPVVNPFVMLREEFDDWAVLFDPDTVHGFGLSPIGVHVWKLLDGEHTIGDLLKEIRAHAEGVTEGARDHIGAFVDQLVAQGLAGFDSNGFGLLNAADGATPRPEKCSHSPLGHGSEVTPLIYEPPKLVDLKGGGRAARGDCGNGSQDYGWCQQGGAAGSNCYTGNGPGSQCGNGAAAPNSMCCTGGAPATTSECAAGDCPHRCANCYHGGGLCQFGYSAGTGTQCATGDGGT